MKKYIFLPLLALLALTGCKEEPEFGDAVFITGTLNSPNVRFVIDGQSQMALTVSSSATATAPVDVEIAPDPAALDKYNTDNGKNYQLPPEGAYSVSANKVTIETGKAVSTPLEITADPSQLEDGVAYCLPVTIGGVGGGLKVQQTSRTAFITFTKVIRTKVLTLNQGYVDFPTFNTRDGGPLWALNQMTLEIKCRPDFFGSTNSIHVLMGSHESLCLRFGSGDGAAASNKLQFAKYSIGTNYHPDNKPHYECVLDETFETGKWYHVATTYDGQMIRIYLDGELVHSVQTQGGQMNLAMSYGGHGWDDTFAIGRAYGKSWLFMGAVSECRIWGVARSQSQIQDGICYVDPTSDGLIGYWRFNGQLQDDGTVLDETGHGHNGHLGGRYSWEENQKCPF